MLAKEYSLSIEKLIRKVKGASYNGSYEILVNPYREIVSALEYRVSQEKFDKFKLYYQGIDGQRLQELVDGNYNVRKLIKDLEEIIENN